MIFLKKRTNRKSNIAGFTLIEMVIVLAIIGMLLALGANSTRFNRSEFVLSTNQDKLRGLISRAKFLTVNSLIGPDVCGYGVRIDKSESKAVVFQINRDISSPCPQRGDLNYENKVVSLTKTPLEGTLNALYFDKGVVVNNSFDIYFLPPDPITVFTENGVLSLSNEITIKLSMFNSERRILINKAGLIDLIKPR